MVELSFVRLTYWQKLLQEIMYSSMAVTGIDWKEHIHRNRRPALIIFYSNGEQYCWVKNGKNYRDFGPSIIDTFKNYYEIFWMFGDKDKTNEIKQWLDDNNIILLKDNDYEIPDEYKTEFKLRFH